MTESPQVPPFGVVVPEDLEAGVYANIVSVWHTPTDFTLDFLTGVPGGMPVELPDGTQARTDKLRAVARVKLPPQQIFELMRALEAQLTAFEQEQQAARPDRPLYPPFRPDEPRGPDSPDDQR